MCLLEASSGGLPGIHGSFLSIRGSIGVRSELPVDPLLGSLETLYYVAGFLSQETGPVFFLHESLSVSDDYKAVLRSSNAYVDPILLLNETT